MSKGLDDAQGIGRRDSRIPANATWSVWASRGAWSHQAIALHDLTNGTARRLFAAQAYLSECCGLGGRRTDGVDPGADWEIVSKYGCSQTEGRGRPHSVRD